uniref:Phospholipase D PiTMPLD putative n=1 Tax=Albugo laibachii Nc14 TaxID=890382 RepID=F0W1B2_9STRA|nr:phospholipase D PiTMPLD putative [Albugo laibachii Nc14]|eukprot:CCA14839.1 phospholipase D PiTMPLD putative [Albugo laibachii Nc14]
MQSPTQGQKYTPTSPNKLATSDIMTEATPFLTNRKLHPKDRKAKRKQDPKVYQTSGPSDIIENNGVVKEKSITIGNGPLPLWFRGTITLAVALTFLCVLSLLAWDKHPVTSHISTLYVSVLNSLIGSYLSASGYCCQKWAHLKVEYRPQSGSASQQGSFILGLVLLALGTVSAILNLGLLGQAVQAPFAALTLIHSALLARYVLREKYSVYDALSSIFIVLGVGVSVFAAQSSPSLIHETYTLQSIQKLFFRNSVLPGSYAITSMLIVIFLLRKVRSARLHRQKIGLFAFSSCAGIMAGYTSLTTKSTLEILKSIYSGTLGSTITSPLFILLVIGIPASLIAQVSLLNKGLEYFGTLKFIPLYQAFIILGNMPCGAVFFNEMQQYTMKAIVLFLLGVSITVSGVCTLLAKVEVERRNSDATHKNSADDQDPGSTNSELSHFETMFAFSEMKWATAESNLDDLVMAHDFDECKNMIVNLMQSATTSIYYSTFLCDFAHPLNKVKGKNGDLSIISCIKAAAARGVSIHILYNPVGDYGTETINRVQAQLPPGVFLTCAISDLGPGPLTKWFSNNSKYAFHHQKYLCVDGKKIMVTGCDVNHERNGWLERNVLGYYWHEVSVVTKCTSDVFDWICRNHGDNELSCTPRSRRLSTVMQTRHHYDEKLDANAAPFPLVSGGWREENAMVNMILHATRSIQLENQIMISGGNLQHNRVLKAIASRVARAYHERDQHFHVIILTNKAQQDEPSLVTRWYCTLSTQWSMEQLEFAMLSYGIPRNEIANFVYVGRLLADGVLVKIHSNILITDGQYALRSSSNLADRSLSFRPTDTELGLLFSGQVVTRFQQNLWNMYFRTKDVPYTIEKVFALLRTPVHPSSVDTKSSGCVVPLRKRPWNPLLTRFLMNAFIHASEGATGGRQKVTYQVRAKCIRDSTLS